MAPLQMRVQVRLVNPPWRGAGSAAGGWSDAAPLTSVSGSPSGATGSVPAAAPDSVSRRSLTV